MEYRNELKFEISDFDLHKIKGRLAPIMHVDGHQDTNGYLVRSLYFDDLYDSCMFEKENGVSNRQKYRLRIYNNASDLIRLEKKSKYADMTQKNIQSLTIQEYNALLSNDKDYLYTILSCNAGTLLAEVAFKILHKNLTPKCIVEYNRFAFVENTGNVRVTFDRNISGSRQIENFLDSDNLFIPILPQGHQILEVKYDELLPQYILQAIELGCLHRQSFSKYYMTRAAIG